MNGLKKNWIILTMFVALVSFVFILPLGCSKKPTETQKTEETNDKDVVTKDSVSTDDHTLKIVDGSTSRPDTVTVDTQTVKITANGYTTVYIDGKMFSISKDADTTLSSVVTLSAGLDTVVVVARDDAGNKDSIFYVFCYDIGVASGKSKITGILTTEGDGVSAKQAKVASNAAGTEYLVTKETIPVSGADILIYDADTTTTSSIASTKTDSLGNWYIELDPGNYFIFAVYVKYSPTSGLKIVTAGIQNVQARANKETKTGERIAVKDEIKPSILAMLDATNPDSTGLYLAASMPAGKPIIPIAFSEPMARSSVGDSVTGVVLGKIDTNASSFALSDTIKTKKLWNGNSSELRIIPKVNLEAGVAYGIVVPSTLVKDLAGNVLESSGRVTFTAIPRDSIVPFIFSGSTPADGDTVLPSTPIFVSFSRPADLMSINKAVSMEPEVSGFLDVSGPKVIFKPDSILKPGSYTVKIPKEVSSLLGDSLSSDTSFTFYVKALTGIATAAGDTGALAQTILKTLNAMVAGDMATFAQGFANDMKMVSKWVDKEHGESGIEVQSKEQFVSQRRREVGLDNIAMEKGLVFPKWYYLKEQDHIVMLNKVFAVGNKQKHIFVETMNDGGGFGGPRFFKADKTPINNEEIRFVQGAPILEYKGEKYGFAPDFSKVGPIPEGQIKDDPVFYGKLIRETSTIEWGEVRLSAKTKFDIRKVQIKGDTGFVSLALTESKVWKGTTRPWPYLPGVDLEKNHIFSEPDTNISAMVIRMKCVKRSGRWLVVRLSANDIYKKGGVLTLPTDVLKDEMFDIGSKTFELPPAVELVSPISGVESAVGSDGSITFEWKKADVDSGLNGYVVGIGEDPAFSPGRPPSGLLVFVDKSVTKLVIDKDGNVDSKVTPSAVVINRRPNELRLHMLPWFEFPINKIDPSYMVFEWGVVGVKDSSARQIITQNGISGTVAQSEYGDIEGYFACGKFLTFEQLDSIAKKLGPQMMPMGGGFNDSDGDGVPDAEEERWGTNPRDPGSSPVFEVDSDQDGYADFLEERFGTDPQDKESFPRDDSEDGNGIKFRDIGYRDSDKDGFPDDVENRMGTNPNDPNNNPGSRSAFEPPIGSFTGLVALGDQDSMPITVKFEKDTSSGSSKNDYRAIFYVKSMVVQDTVDTVKAFFDQFSGEMSFLVKFSESGSKAGKALKLRGHYDGMMGRIGGAVDMVRAMEGPLAVGPYVAQWLASNRSGDTITMANVNNNGGGAPGQPGPGDPNMGLPMKPPNADTVWLFVEKKDEDIDAKLVYKNNARDTLFSKKVVDRGGFLEMVFVKGEMVMHLNGNLFPVPGSDTLGCYGGLFIEDTMGVPMPFGGGFGFKKCDKNLTDIEGKLDGWIFIDQSMGGNNGPGFGGPPEYTGGIDSLLKILEEEMGAKDADDTVNIVFPSRQDVIKIAKIKNILPVDSFPNYYMLNSGCVFVITEDKDTLLIFGAPDNRDNPDIFVNMDKKKVLSADMPPPAGKSGGVVAPNGGVPFYKGDMKVIESLIDEGKKIGFKDKKTDNLVVLDKLSADDVFERWEPAIMGNVVAIRAGGDIFVFVEDDQKKPMMMGDDVLVVEPMGPDGGDPSAPPPEKQ